MKKISNADLLDRIKEHGLALDSGELIKCCGYVSIDSNGNEIPLVEEFYQAHIKAIQNSRNFGKEILEFDIPRKEYIGTLPKGNYLIGDLDACLVNGDENLIREFRKSENLSEEETIDLNELIPFSERKVLNNNTDKKKLLKRSENGGISIDSYGERFLYLQLWTDESLCKDMFNRTFSQHSMALGCIKDSAQNFKYSSEIIQETRIGKQLEVLGYCIEFFEEFICTYYPNYELLKLGDFLIWN